jgi:4-amino-4-deoxy-L-arabinose transferase-like glycosyltransferase
MKPANVRLARWLPAGLGLLAALLIFAGLGSGSLHNLDESRHALVAENILHDGDWLTLHHEDAPYFNKAPLKFWLTALTFRLGGVNAWTARLWSALFAWGAVVVTGLLGARLYDRRTGLLAAFILATSTQFLYSHCARTGELDSALLFFWTLACLLVVAGTRRRPLFYLGCAPWACAGWSNTSASCRSCC